MSGSGERNVEKGLNPGARARLAALFSEAVGYTLLEQTSRQLLPPAFVPDLF